MSVSLRLSVADLTDHEAAGYLYLIEDAATGGDGHAPFNEQARLDLDAGRRSLVLAFVDRPDTPGPVAAAAIGQGELDLVVLPAERGRGNGGAFLEALLADFVPPETPVVAWSHGDHPAARALGASHGFAAVRTLLELGVALPAAGAEGAERMDTFRVGVDEGEWVALNARIFASHPEQGRVTVDDLRARGAEPWFDAGDFLVLRDESGAMIGYNWLKVTGDTGEIYVIGVDAASAGHGLGRRLMLAGLERLAERGCSTATLYVEADNAAAVGLYRSLGFTDHSVDVQYSRGSVPTRGGGDADRDER